MKKIMYSLLLVIFAITANGQYKTSLVEDFDTSCAAGSGSFPLDWIYYNPIASTIPNGVWQCSATNGRWGTPGIECTGIWGTPETYNTDTSYLITPGLDLSGYTGSIYLEFDSKTSDIVLGGRLALIAGTVDTLFGRSSADTLSPPLTPLITPDDSSGWVTHEVDLTPYAGNVPIYVAFLYTSTTSAGGVWYIDNVHTTTFPLKTPDITKNTLPLTVIGSSTPSQITLAYKTGSPGVYNLSVYDIIGHKVYEEDVSTQGVNTTYTISGLNLHSGMYLIKMDNGLTYGTTKTIVP